MGLFGHTFRSEMEQYKIRMVLDWSLCETRGSERLKVTWRSATGHER